MTYGFGYVSQTVKLNDQNKSRCIRKHKVKSVMKCIRLRMISGLK